MQAQAAGVSIGVSARLRELPTSFLTQTAISTLLGDALNEATNQRAWRLGCIFQAEGGSGRTPPVAQLRVRHRWPSFLFQEMESSELF